MEPTTLTARVKAVGVEETIAKVQAASRSINAAQISSARAAQIGQLRRGAMMPTAAAALGAKEAMDSRREVVNATRETEAFRRSIESARRALDAHHLALAGRAAGRDAMRARRAIDDRAVAVGDVAARRGGFGGRPIIVAPPSRDRWRAAGVMARRRMRQMGPFRVGLVGMLIAGILTSILEFVKEVKRLGDNLWNIPAIRGTVTAIGELLNLLAKMTFPPSMLLEELNNWLEGKPFGQGIVDRFNRAREAYGLDPVDHPAERPNRRSSWESIYNDRYGRAWGR